MQSLIGVLLGLRLQEILYNLFVYLKRGFQVGSLLLQLSDLSLSCSVLGMRFSIAIIIHVSGDCIVIHLGVLHAEACRGIHSLLLLRGVGIRLYGTHRPVVPRIGPACQV
jgi:hypothetical protein